MLPTQHDMCVAFQYLHYMLFRCEYMGFIQTRLKFSRFYFDFLCNLFSMHEIYRNAIHHTENIVSNTNANIAFMFSYSKPYLVGSTPK